MRNPYFRDAKGRQRHTGYEAVRPMETTTRK